MTIGVKIGVTKDDGEVFYRRIEDLSPYVYLTGGRYYPVAKDKDQDLLRTLKLYALQEYLEEEEVPSDEDLGKFKMTVYYHDTEGDKIVIGSARELCAVLTDAQRRSMSNSRNSMAKLMARIVAKVEPAQSPPSLTSSPLDAAAATSRTPTTKPTATTSTQTVHDTADPAPTTPLPPPTKSPPVQVPVEATARQAPNPVPTCSLQSPPQPPTLQDVVDAVVAVVGPAVRVSVRAVEHAVSQVAAAEAQVQRAAVAAKKAKQPLAAIYQSAPASTTTAAASTPRPFIHGYHTCDGCYARPIVGTRYHCTDPDRMDYDLCAQCYSNYSGTSSFEPAWLERDEAFQDRWAAEAEAKMASESRPKSSPEPAETTVPAVTMQPEASSPRPFIHGRHTCDGCLATPIVGTRYHCLDLPDFDLCHSCHAHYDGPNRFEAVQLERDVPFQERWHRRRARWAHRGGGACARRGGGHHRRNGRWGPLPHPVGSTAGAPPPAGEVDEALREALRRSLQDLKMKDSGEKDVAAVVATENAHKDEMAPDATAAAAPAVVGKTDTIAPAGDAKPAAVPGTPTSRYTVHDDSDEEDAKEKAFESPLLIAEEPTASAEMTARVASSLDSSKDVLVAAGSDDGVADDKSNVDVSMASEFADDAEGNGAVAAALGNMMDMVASCIQEMNAVDGAVAAASKSTVDMDDSGGGVKIVDGEDEKHPRSDDNGDNLSLGSDSSHGSWVVDDDFVASPEAMARAAMVIGSSLLSSDMAQSTGNVNPTATSTLTSSSSTSAAGAVDALSFSSMGSVPSTVPSIANSRAAATTASQQVSAPQLERWAVQLRQLHELGFHDDAGLVDIIERLNAANIGVDSTEEVTVQQVVHELMKN